jgi:hypothetical protein
MTRHQSFREMLARREELSSAEESSLAAHLRDCSHCRQAAAAYERQDTLIRTLQLVPPSDAFKAGVLDQLHHPPTRRARQRAWPAPALAAALVVAVILLVHAPTALTPPASHQSAPARFGPQRSAAPLKRAPSTPNALNAAIGCGTGEATPPAQGSQTSSPPYGAYQSPASPSCADRAPPLPRASGASPPGAVRLPAGPVGSEIDMPHRLSSNPNSAVFIFGRTGGFIPPYRVTIRAGGTVTLQTPAATSAHLPGGTAPISTQALLGLLRMAEANGFFSLPRRIQGRRMIHAPSYSITVATASARRTVTEVGQSNDRFFRLYDALRKAAGVCIPKGTSCDGR